MRKLLLAGAATLGLVGTAQAASPLFDNVGAVKVNTTEQNKAVVGKGATADYYGYYGNYYNNLAGYYGNRGLYYNNYSNYYSAYAYTGYASNNYYFAYYYSVRGF